MKEELSGRQRFLSDMIGLILGILLGLAVCSLFSCSTKRVVTTVAVHDTVRVVQKDSTLVLKHDSVFVKLWQKGDTVFQMEYRERVAYRDRLRLDTFYVHRTDTVRVTSPNSTKVGVTWWQRLAIGIWGLLSVVAICALILVWVFGKCRE